MTPSARSVRAAGRGEFKDALFLHGWELVHVSLNSCDCFQMCAVSLSSRSLSLFLSLFFHLPPKSLGALLLHPFLLRFTSSGL